MTTSYQQRVHAAVMSLAQFIGDAETLAAYQEQLRDFDRCFQSPEDQASQSKGPSFGL